jgi:peptidoglycan/LPS O-acetylase OafA/YrhL
MHLAKVYERLGALAANADSSFNPAIQGLRGLAALSVVIGHLYAMPTLAGIKPLNFPEALRVAIDTSGRGVELFFIISGYLIPASLVRHRRVSTFLYDRVMRIMPVFLMLHLVIFVLGPIAGYKFFAGIDLGAYAYTFIANLLFVPDLAGVPIAQQNAWTLTYEWLFYLWFAAFYFHALARGSTLAALTLGLLAIAVVAIWPRSAFFAIGMLLAGNRYVLDIRGVCGVVVGLGLTAITYALCEYVAPYAGLLPGLLLFAMVLARRSGFARLLATRPLQFAGRISYSLYLVHPFVLYGLVAVATRAVAHGADRWLVLIIFAGLGLLLSLAVAAVSFDLIELRLRRRLDALVRGGPPARHPDHRAGATPSSAA